MFQHPTFPANAGTQIHPQPLPPLLRHDLTIWAPAFAGEVGEKMAR
jgi:hypothetical protein